VWRRARGSPLFDLCAGLGQGGRRRARTAEQDDDGCCDLKSGGTAAFPGQCVKARAPTGPREESKVVVRRRTRAERKLGQGAAMAARRSLGCDRCAGARQGKAVAFIGGARHAVKQQGARGTGCACWGACDSAGGWHERGPVRKRGGDTRGLGSNVARGACGLGMRASGCVVGSGPGRRGATAPTWPRVLGGAALCGTLGGVALCGGAKIQLQQGL
jgi:hypothetical protein